MAQIKSFMYDQKCGSENDEAFEADLNKSLHEKVKRFRKPRPSHNSSVREIIVNSRKKFPRELSASFHNQEGATFAFRGSRYAIGGAKVSIWLDFIDKNDELHYSQFMKAKLNAPAFWAFCVLLVGVAFTRLNLASSVYQGPYFIASFALSLLGVCLYLLYIFRYYSQLFPSFLRSRFPCTRLQVTAGGIIRIFFFGDIESVICILVAIGALIYIVSRVLQGNCDNSTSIFQTTGCNPSNMSKEPPTDAILASYLGPLCMQICIKGVPKNSLFLSWCIATTGVAWGVLYLRGYSNLWDILYSLFILLILYETERLKMSSFLQNKYALLEEMKKRRTAEKEYVTREKELQKIENAKSDFEALAANRAAVLSKLPLHKGILDRVEVDNLLSLIAEHIDTAKMKDYDGRTAFTLILDYPDADIRAVTQLLMNSLPVDPNTELPVDAAHHEYAWTRAVQYEKYEYAIVFVLSLYPSIAVQLSIAEDKEGRQVVHIASPKCKKAIMRYLLFFRRYEILTLAQPHYKTETSIVHLAVDHESEDDDKMVAMKFMKERAQFLREVRVRAQGNFSEVHVMGGIRVHDCDEDPDFRDEAVAKGFVDFPYCFVMHVGERNLGDVMVKEHLAGRDWGQIRMITWQIASAVGHMHHNGFIHGDLKPLNIMRVGQKMKLIDLDASVSFISGTEFSAMKFSSGYVCPELIYYTDQVVCVRSKAIKMSMMQGRKSRAFDFDLVPASEAHDLWSLGVVIYNIAANAPLFLCDGDGNIEDSDLRLLADWSDSLKVEKLSRVKNTAARNLISLLLSKEPKRRPSIRHVLVHPFLTGKKLSRLISDEAEFDVFLSYRVATDGEHAKVLYHMLRNLGLRVWWDKECLKPGEPWDVGFCVGLMKSKVFLPIISQGAIGCFKDLNRESQCDHLLLEFVLALELRERGRLDKIFPLFIGPRNPETDTYSKYTFSGANACHPQSLPDISVSSVEARLIARIDELGLGLPFVEAMTVSSIVTSVLKYQGTFVEGNLESSMTKTVSHALMMFGKTQTVPSDSPKSQLGDVTTKCSSGVATNEALAAATQPVVLKRISSYRMDAKFS